MKREEVQKIIEGCFKERKGCLVILKNRTIIHLKAGSLQPWKKGTIIGHSLPGQVYTEIKIGHVLKLIKVN